ncbi:MAG TPA: hypothetical protein VHM48_08990 [Candidatus Limnocylindrales bacterium]|nr:hypothetical protein [Candidatus Limnocylindrales bacterium]
MPIVVRRGRVVAEPRSRLLRFERPAAIPTVATAVGSEPRAPDPRHELAHLALDLVVRTAEPVDLPRRWATPMFGREVDRTRAQLAPIRSRAGLIASFSREAAIAVTRSADGRDQPAGPVRVAYAIRWLELGDGRRRPAWESFVAGPVAIVAGAISGVVGPVSARPGVCALAGPQNPVRAGDQRKGEITT